MGEQKPADKPFAIPKQEVWDAWLTVKANRGAPGVDGQSIEDFEADLKGNLYKIWNRMSSGSYFPPPVKAVQIPKAHGAGTRMLGVPTVADRVAQTVVAARLETVVEPTFNDDSYGYRPGRSALDAVDTCRHRCWSYAWVVDLDIRAFFDSVPWDLILKAVEANTTDAWVILYVRRWLAAGLRMPDGTLAQRDRGTPQGSAVSPVLANLFLHYAFDQWMGRKFPDLPFERYVDDAVVHCRTEKQARMIRTAVQERMGQVGLSLHPDKTRLVYCQDGNRTGSYEHTAFDFLGFTFRARGMRTRQGRVFTGFGPAISKTALGKISAQVRSWRLHRHTDYTIGQLARWINPIVRGWMQYYGAFYRSALYPLLRRINGYLVRWMRKKYKRLRTFTKAHAAWGRLTTQYPRGFAHFPWVTAHWRGG